MGPVYWLLKGSGFELSRVGKYGLFCAKKLMERLYLLVTEKFLFWALKSSCFEFFGDGKTVFFLIKKLMERSYLLGLFELSKIFQDLENMVLRAV